MTPRHLKISSLLLACALVLPAARAEEAPVNSDLNSNTLYALLLAEISAQSGDVSSAFQLMLDTAQRSRSSQLFERAIEIALRARAGDSALQAAQAWARVQPTSRDATRYLLQILVGLNKLAETVDPIKRELTTLAPKERINAINQIPRFFVRVGDKKMAAKVAEQALGSELANPATGPAAYAAIGTMRLLAADADGALDAARKGFAINSKAEEPMQLALALMDPKLPAAEELVSKNLHPGTRAELRMAYVRKLLEAQRLQDAKAQTVLINTYEPTFADGWLVRGSLAHQEKRNDEARMALGKVLDLKQKADSTRGDAPQDKGLSQAYILLADLAEHDRQWSDALHYLELVDSPQDALRVLSRRAALLARQGKLEVGRALIRSVPELQPDDARAKINAETQLLRENKQHQATYDLLQQVVQEHPGDADYLYDLAMAAEKLDRVDEMESLLRQVIARKPDYHHAYNALGYSLADRKLRLDEARALVRKALEFAPNDPFILDSLGWVEFRSGNLAQALNILQGAYQSRQDPEIAAHLGEVLWNLSQQVEARAIWKEAMAQSPDNDTLNETVKRLSQP